MSSKKGLNDAYSVKTPEDNIKFSAKQILVNRYKKKLLISFINAQDLKN